MFIVKCKLHGVDWELIVTIERKTLIFCGGCDELDPFSSEGLR